MFGGTADWVNFFNLELAIISVAGLVIFGFIFVWIFGREFGNRTFYDLLALPTSRIAIVSAKIIIAACWAFFLILITFVFMVILGNILNLPGGSSDIILTGLKQLLVTGLLTIILCLPFAMVACVTRGYLPAIGCIFMVLILSQVFDTLGYGLYFPWCIPAIYSGAATSLTGSIAEPAGTVSYILLGITGTIGVIVTGLWWLYADQS